MMKGSKKNDALSGRLSLGQTFAYSAGQFSATFLPMVITNFLMYYYCPLEEKEGGRRLLMAYGTFAVVQFIGKISDSVSNALVGYLSDRTRSRWGRRIPYIIFGTPLMVISFALLWFPLTDHPSLANNLWLGVNLVIFWGAYTFVVAPYLALLPDIAPSNEERIKVGAFMAGGDVLGFALGGAVGILLSLWAAGVKLGPLSFSSGHQVVGMGAGFVVLIFFWLTWWFIRESPHQASKEVSFNFFEAAKETFQNPVLPYYLVAVTLLNPIQVMAFGLMPYYADGILHLGERVESWVAIFQGTILLAAAACLPLITIAANRWGKKKIFMWGVFSFAFIMPLVAALPLLRLPPDVARYVTLALFALLGPGACAMLTLWRPIISDIIDLDEKLTGFRREAMYMGMEGVITKLGAGLGPVFIALNFALFGKPDGILTAYVTVSFLVFITCYVFRYHPITK